MVNKKFSPTNKKFKKHFEDFASTKPKKGHLGSGERDNDETAIKVGKLVRIHRAKLYDRGWEVKIDNKTYMCTYGDNVIMIPKSTVTEKYFIPKKTTKVEIQMDKVSKIYSIIRIQDDNTVPIAMYDNTLTISTNTNTKTNKKAKAEISLTQETIKMAATNMNIDGTLKITGKVEADNIKEIEEKNKVITDDINELQEEVVILKREIETMKSGDNDGGES